MIRPGRWSLAWQSWGWDSHAEQRTSAEDIAARPNMPSANLLLGIAFTQMHRVDDAVAAFRRETELDPKNAQARMLNRLRQQRALPSGVWAHVLPHQRLTEIWIHRK